MIPWWYWLLPASILLFIIIESTVKGWRRRKRLNQMIADVKSGKLNRDIALHILTKELEELQELQKQIKRRLP